MAHFIVGRVLRMGAAVDIEGQVTAAKDFIPMYCKDKETY